MDMRERGRSERTSVDCFFGRLYGDSSVPSDQGSDFYSLGDTLFSITLHKPTNKPDSLCFLGLDLAAGKNDLHRSCFPDEVGQSLCSSGTREDTERDFRLAERGGRGGDEDIAHHGEFASSSELWRRVKRVS